MRVLITMAIMEGRRSMNLADCMSWYVMMLRGFRESDANVHLAGRARDSDCCSEPDFRHFEIKSVLGKGKGLVALVHIAKSTRILCEEPLFTAGNISSISVMDDNVATKLGKHAFSGIVNTNALPCGPDSTTGGVYPAICLVNHSCLPNAHNNWNSDKQHETTHAIRDIAAGEEITISYDHGGSASTRRALLKEAVGFDCTCCICSLPAPDLQASDARRTQMETLDDEIGNSGCMIQNPELCLADCRALLQVLQEEYQDEAGVLLCRLYYDAFQVCGVHSDQARASVFAEMRYTARVICEGDDSPETARMKTVAQDPTDHVKLGASRRWRSAKGLVPKGLTVDGFEKWLWRE